MGLRRYAGATGLLGGLAWLGHLALENDGVWWAGLALLTLACAAAGAALVSTGAPALRALTTAALPVLVGSVWWVLREESGDVRVVDALVGAAVGLAGLGALARSRE